MRKTYGYVRVSSREQNEDRQMMAMRESGVPDNHIFLDKQSGKDFQRPAYQKMIKRLRQGDVLIIKSIDRLGRNYREILMEWQRIRREIGADILVLDMKLLDTRRKEENLTGTLIADLVLQILAYVAQTEREMIRQRQAEGIAAAKAKGKKFGRRPLPLPEGFERVCEQYLTGALSCRQAAAQLGMSRSTFCRKTACFALDERNNPDNH